MRRPRRTFVALVLAIAASFIGAGWLAAKPKPAVKIDLTAVSTKDLIGRFQKVSKQGIGADTMVAVEGFIALDTPLRFGGGVLGVPAPKVSPIMRELVRRGVVAVPALLDHLSDDRPTKLLVGDSNFFTVRWYGNEYDPKDPAQTELPPGLKRLGNGDSSGLEDFTTHRVTVGDLCFVTLGQIVNRKLLAVRYQPSQCLVVNSPVHSTALAAAIRSDWSKLTDAGFEEYLIQDIANRSEGASPVGALQRMLFYYPDDGYSLAIKLIGRELCSGRLMRSLLDPIESTPDESVQDKLLAEIEPKHGEVYHRAVVQYLIFDATEPAPDPELAAMEPKWIKQRDIAIKLVARRFANANKYPPPDRLVVTPDIQSEIVETLTSFPSADVDQAVQDLLKRTLALQTGGVEDKNVQCDLAIACARRLVPKDRHKAFEQQIKARDQHLRNRDAAAGDKNVESNLRFSDGFLRRLSALCGIPAPLQ